MARYGFIGICSVLVLALVNCGSALKNGTLIKKAHEPERSWVQMIPISTGSATVVIPIVHYDDEDWVFVIEDSPKNGKKSKQQRIYVSQEAFTHHEEGDWIEVADLGEVKDKDKSTKSKKPGESQSG